MPSESNHLPERQIKSKQMNSGIINTGYDYEKLVPAFFALQLLQDQNVKSFEFQLNSSSYEKFDDLLVTVVDRNDKVEKFAIQIKHRERGQDKINAAKEFNRTDNKGKPKGFNISSYLKAYEEHPREVQNEFKFILFTNARFTSTDRIINYKVQHACKTFTTTLFDSEDTYQLVEDCPANIKKTTTFYQNFFLCSAQKNYNKMRDSIVEYFKNNFYSTCEEASRYIQFFQQLHRGQFNNTTITRDEIVLKLARILLSNYTILSPITRERQETIELIERTFKIFDVTILSDIPEEFVQNNWKYFIPIVSKEFNTKAMDFKFIEKNETLSNVADRLLIEISCYLMEKPLFLKVNQDSERIIYTVCRLLKTLEHRKVKLILVGRKTDEKFFQEWEIFRNLQQLQTFYNLIYQKVISKLKLSFQGKEAVSIDVLEKRYSLDLNNTITPNEIFQLLEGDLKIGENVDLPETYIDRTLLKSEITLRQLEELCLHKKVIVDCNGRSTSCKQFLDKKNFKYEIKILSSYKIDLSHSKNSTLYLTDGPSLLDSECLLLKYLGQDTFHWMKSKVEPNDSSVFDNQVNLVVGESGCGKTTFMKYLINKCPPNYWPLTIPMQQIKSIVPEEETNEMLKKFMNFERQSRTHQRLYDFFLKNKRIICFFGGLNELDGTSLNVAINLIKKIKEEGLKIWMFSTNNLKNQLESNLKPTCYSLKELSLEEQKDYVSKTLEKTELDEETRNEIIEKLFNENLHTFELLKVPLFLYILTEILSRNTNTYSLEQILNLNKMYNSFFEGKVQHIWHKIKCNHLEPLKPIVKLFKKYYYKCYQTIALKICLKPNNFELLNVNPDKDFLEYLNIYKDFVGFLEYNGDEKFEFSHRTFAEYFAAMWLAENFKEFPQDRINFIFEPHYDGIRRFFDGILAEGCPLHLAVLDQDMNRIEKYAEKHLRDTDKAGRTVLHLMMTHAKKFPIVKNRYKIDPKDFEKEEKILQYLLSLVDIKDLLQKDEYFKWNCFEYADALMSLSSLEELSKTFKIEKKHLSNCIKHPFTVSYFCIKMGYIHFLKIFVSIFKISEWEGKYLENLGISLLHFAIQNDQEEIALMLIENGANITTPNKQQMLLHEAANWGHIKLTRLLIKKGLDPDGKINLGKTPLHVAARMGHEEIVKVLVQAGVDINARTADEETVLHKAAYMGRTQILRYLVDNGGNTDVIDDKKRTPLHRASEMGYCETVKYLINEQGANINRVDSARRRALHYAAYEGHKDVVEYLIEQKTINVFAKDVDGETAKDKARQNGHETIVELLENAEKEKTNSQQPQKQIHVAAKTNNLQLLQKLLDEGENIEEANELVETPLHLAAFRGYSDMVEFLLSRKADVAAINCEGRVPLHLACHNGNTKIVKDLINRGQDEARDKWGLTPLHRAAHEGHLEVVKILKESGVSLSSECRIGTPLHSAARGGHTNIVKYLIESGVNVDLINERGETCLHAAARRGSTKVVEYLTQYHKHLLDLTDCYERTALHFAAEKGYMNIVKILVNCGADLNKLDVERKTPLDVAKYADRKQIIEFLRQSKNSL